jgi:hypothetical protein
MMSPFVPSTEDKWYTVNSICNCYLLADLPRMSRTELTMSSLEIILRRENRILKVLTHGIPFNNEGGFTRPAMMYLYAMWDVR